jgi:hypothetical protein
VALAELDIPLTLLATAPVSPRDSIRVHALMKRYEAGLPVPSIPVWLTQHGDLILRRDGNHRLAAARRAAVETVKVNLDDRDAARLRRMVERR